MGTAATDDELLIRQDADSFELFYSRYFERLLVFFARRTCDAELAADLTAETFAAALAGRRRYRPQRGGADSPTTSSAMRSGGVAPKFGRDDGWASSASSSRTTTSPASTSWGNRTRSGSSCASCPLTSKRRSRRT